MNYTKKKLISEMLESWYVLDHILFGGIPKSYLKESDYQKYLQLKKTYVQTLFEMYTFVGYHTKYTDCPADQSEIQIMALKTVRESKVHASKTLINESKKFSKILKESKINENLGIKKLSLSCQFESAFFTNQIKRATKPNNFDNPKCILLKNCLNECKKELINLSIKNMK